MGSGRALIVYLGSALIAVTFLYSSDASALSACSETEVIGVRGSGQLYGQSPELKAIREKLPDTIHYIELENEISTLKNLPRYAAVQVSKNGILNYTGVEAVVTSQLDLGIYRASVNSGKNLLKKYIESFRGSSTCLVLVGFSQGAQVINETVRDMHAANPNSLKNVIYIGLLGDPLYQPYGFDPTKRPTWLRGSALYPYWGVLYKCQTRLVLGENIDYVPRNPTNPLYPFTKIGSWCNYGDVICATDTTHFVAMRDGHASYIQDGIPQLVDEIKVAVANPDQNITGAIYPNSQCGAAKQDLVILLDTSAYMLRNRDLFTKAKNDWDTKLAPGTNLKMMRTFGEQLLDSGCGDKRVAIVGFEGPSGQDPRLLLDFTSSASAIDELMDSLYRPSSGGLVERPQVREAAVLAMRQNWRSDASRTVFAITPLAGDGPAPTSTRENWASRATREMHMNDAVGQELLELSRQTRASIISAQHLPIDLSGFTIPEVGPGAANAYTYFQGLAHLTGGYNWTKVFKLYVPATVKNVDFSSQIQQFEKRRDGTRVGMQNIRVKVGETVTLKLDDSASLLASAGVRGNGTATEWFLDCSALQKQSSLPELSQSSGTITFTPTKTGTCMAAVRVAVQANGNGCYSGCPEPFPPYLLSTIPFKLDIRSADYVDKVPGVVIELEKTIHDDRVEFAWRAPHGSDGNLAYLIKDDDGSVLGVSTATRATVTDTAGEDANILIQAMGDDGMSEIVSSMAETTEVKDRRTEKELESVVAPIAVIDAVVRTVTQMLGLGDSSSAIAASAQPVIDTVDIAPDVSATYVLGETIAESTVPVVHTSPTIGEQKVDRSENLWWFVLIILSIAVMATGVRLARHKG